MKVEWEPNSSVIIMTLSSGEVIETSAKLWARAGAVVNSAIFDTFSAYWNQAPLQQVQELERLYKDAYKIMDMSQLNEDIEDMKEQLKLTIATMLDLYDWPRFRLWCLTTGQMNSAIGVKTDMTDKDTNGMTYLTSDYEDLIVLSVMLKTVMPIWGMFELVTRKTIGKLYINGVLIELLRYSQVVDLPPYKRLECYIAEFSDVRITTLGFSLNGTMGTEEVPDHLLAIAIIKKIIIFNGRLDGDSCITNVYHVLNAQCKHINKGKPNNKRNRDDRGEDISISDRYKITQQIPPGVIVLVEHYLEDPVTVMSHVDPDVPVKALHDTERRLSNGLVISDFHLPLVAGVLSKVITGRTMKLVNYVSMLNAIAVASTVCRHWGFIALAELMITQAEEKDMFKINISSTQQRTFQLKVGLAKELNELYPLSGAKHPGMVLMDKIVTEVGTHDWDIDQSVFCELRNDIAQLLLKLGE